MGRPEIDVPGEKDVQVADQRAYDAVLRESGHGILSEGLQPVQTATTVRVRSGKVYTTASPFAETTGYGPTARRLTSCPAG